MASQETWTRERVKQRLLGRFYTRFHMSLILLSSAMAAMVTSWALLQMGVGSMLARYPMAVAMAYLTFLGCVGLWLRYVGVGRDDGESKGSNLDSADVIPDIRIGGSSSSSGGGGGGLGGGRGGSFDGGGASAAWAEGSAGAGNARLPAIALAEGQAGGGAGKELGDLAGGVDGDFIVVVLAIAVIVAILAASGYLIFMAPDILTEAAFGALLAGTLARRSRREDAGGWVSGVVKKTWWPFALVLVIAMVFAGYCAATYPQAQTFRQALDAATQ